MISGKAITFGDNIDTDQIIGAHHLNIQSIRAMSEHTFEHHQNFTAHFTRGDILVGKNNFGCGSSREQAPAVLKERGVSAIIAKSFARIFFRNGINLGMRLIECPQAGDINALDRLVIENDRVRNLTTDADYGITPYPQAIMEIINHNGILSLCKA